jgi:hypothetical protein
MLDKTLLIGVITVIVVIVIAAVFYIIPLSLPTITSSNVSSFITTSTSLEQKPSINETKICKLTLIKSIESRAEESCSGERPVYYPNGTRCYTLYFSTRKEIAADEKYIYLPYANGTIEVIRKSDWEPVATLFTKPTYRAMCERYIATNPSECYFPKEGINCKLYPATEPLITADENYVYATVWNTYLSHSTAFGELEYPYTFNNGSILYVWNKNNFQLVKQVIYNVTIFWITADEKYIYLNNKIVVNKTSLKVVGELKDKKEPETSAIHLGPTTLKSDKNKIYVGYGIGKLKIFDKNNFSLLISVDLNQSGMTAPPQVAQDVRELAMDDNYIYVCQAFNNASIINKNGEIVSFLPYYNCFNSIAVDDHYIYIASSYVNATGSYVGDITVFDKKTKEKVETLKFTTGVEKLIEVGGYLHVQTGGVVHIYKVECE